MFWNFRNCFEINQQNVTTRNFDLPHFFGTKTLVVGQSAPPALPLATQLNWYLSRFDSSAVVLISGAFKNSCKICEIKYLAIRNAHCLDVGRDYIIFDGGQYT